MRKEFLDRAQKTLEYQLFDAGRDADTEMAKGAAFCNERCHNGIVITVQRDGFMHARVLTSTKRVI